MILLSSFSRSARRALAVLALGAVLAGCSSTSQVSPAGTDTFAIKVQGTDSASESAEDLRNKLKGQFQAKAQQVTDDHHYERYELVSFEVDREQKGGATVPVGRGTIHCFR
jgi:phosphate-selective porin